MFFTTDYIERESMHAKSPGIAGPALGVNPDRARRRIGFTDRCPVQPGNPSVT